jgi:lambda family phage minor tail protein L
MTSTAPVSHKQEAQKLTADALVDLFTITLKNVPVVFRFKEGNEVIWQGLKFEGMACHMTGDNRSADGEESKPSLQIMNPLGVFNAAAVKGQLDLAVVRRQRVLQKHIDGNVGIFQQRMWYVGRVRELISGQSISFDLRNMTEGANFQIPVRMFTPPEFPMVTL